MDYTAHYNSPLGGITLGSDGTTLIGLWFDGQKYFADVLQTAYMEKELPVFAETRRWLDAYFHGEAPEVTPALTMRCSAFCRSVWDVMLGIPYGKTMTYGEIAAQVARESGLPHMSAQAVGGAVGHNAISLIIPCHRVVGSDGSLVGYAGGIDKKARLLAMERINIAKQSTAKR